jgi:hypothetical protein
MEILLINQHEQQGESFHVAAIHVSERGELYSRERASAIFSAGAGGCCANKNGGPFRARRLTEIAQAA